METMKLDYNMEAFNEDNIKQLLSSLGLDVNNFFMGMTKPSVASVALVGALAQFSNRYCIISFSETELNLIMLSRLDNKKVTDLIKISRNEITKVKLSDVLISYMLKIKTNDSSFKIQVFKKFGKFSNIKTAIQTFKGVYIL